MWYDRDAVIAKAIDALKKTEAGNGWASDRHNMKISAAWLKVADRMDKDTEVDV